MANRFSRLPQGPTLSDNIISLADMGVRLQNQKQQAALSQQEFNLRNRKMAEDERINRINYGRGEPGAADYRPGLMQQKQQAELNTPERQFGLYMSQKPDIAKIIQSQEMYPGKSLDPLFNGVKERLANGEYGSRWDLYHDLKQKQSFFTMQARESIMNEIKSAVKSGESMKAAQLTQLMEMTGDDNFVEHLFGFPENMMPKRGNYSMPMGSTTTNDYGQPKEGLDENGNPVYFVTDKQGNVKKLSGFIPEPKNGITIDKDGNIQIGGSSKLTAKTQGALEQKAIDNDDLLVKTENSLNQFNQEYLTFQGKAKGGWLDFKERFKIGNIDQEDKKYIANFSTFAQDSIENINAYIKAITGAQMSEKEADRIRLAMPDPGDGLFSGDGPTKFLSKANNVLKKAKLAKARSLLLKERGLDVDTSNLEKIENAYGYDRVEKMINEKSNEIGEMYEIQNPGKSEHEIKSMVATEIKKRYGI